MINGYKLTDPASATNQQRDIFAKSENRNGFVPNIVNAFSESPVLANSMLDLYAKFGDTSFDSIESHIVLQTINVLNECLYCVPAHSTMARKGGVDVSLDESLRSNQPIENPKHEALRKFTTHMVEQRGHVNTEEFEDFINAGYSRQAALDVVFLITVKTLTNYGNHITGTDLDDAFEPLEWTPSSSLVS
jgi:alkylhydroperoxidase family enzyme